MNQEDIIWQMRALYYESCNKLKYINQSEFFNLGHHDGGTSCKCELYVCTF